MSRYRAGSLVTVAGEISKQKSDIVGVQEVRWDRDHTEPVDELLFFYGKGNENHKLATGLLYISDHMSS
jgi:hypothetical protein